ncbi:MAG: hypothetical protein G01um101466_321 [Parcubacteria group bacterium Gr01-1014_66]|nr:MAG: hypothetical protein G01um101466_321 [Parcubacteria group bacterium Gr01-1014_66]
MQTSVLRFTFFHRLRTPPLMVIDVGAGAIRGLLFEEGQGAHLPKILHKNVRSTEPSITPARLIQEVHTFLFEVTKELGYAPKKVIIGIGSDIAEFSLTLIRYAMPHPQRTINASELSGFFREQLDEHQDASRFLLAYPLGVRANGYPISASLLEKGDTRSVKELEFPTLFAWLGRETGEAFDQLRQMLGGMNIVCMTIPEAYRITGETVLDIRDGFYIDIGSETTLLTLVKEGALTAVSSFSYGTHKIARAIADARTLSFSQAQDLLRHYMDGSLHEDAMRKVIEIIAQSVREWERNFLKALEVCYHHGPFPAMAVLCGEGARLQEIRALLMRGEWLRALSYVSTPHLKVLEGRSVFGGDSLGGFLQGSEDARIGALMHAWRYEQSFN